MIEVEHLTKYYGPHKAAINDITFDVKQGEILGFLGPNGAGKTTTMRIITCFMAPTSGTARVAGYDIFESSLEVRRNIGYLPENVPLYREMTVRGYLGYCAALRNVPRRERAERMERVMDRTHITDVADTIIGRLSKGYRQRVGIAQALVHDPPVLIMDEPTIGLDPSQTRDVRNLIKELGRDHTIIFSTHLLSEVEQICNRVVIVDRGEIAAVDTPDNLTRQVRQSDRILLRLKRAPSDAASQMRRIKGVTRVEHSNGVFTVDTTLAEDLREDLAALAVNKGWGLLELRRVEVTLEDAFIEITSRQVQEILAQRQSDEAEEEPVPALRGGDA